MTSHGRTPRITSICLRYLSSAQTNCFSIHLQAQFENKDFDNLTIEDYDLLEENMLNEFYEFARKHKDYKWIHWNMRDSNFGFEAISNRFRILGGEPFCIDDDRRFDFPRILGKLYTYDYEKNEPNGRLLNLANRNNLTVIDAMKGEDEATAFQNKEYLKLHKSSLRKVDIISSLIDRADKDELKVNVNILKINGLSIPGVIEIVKNNWILLVLWSIIVFIIGAVFQTLFLKLLGISN